MKQNSILIPSAFYCILMIMAFLVIAALLASCANLLPSNISTPLPTEFLPTAAALTVAASGAISPAESQILPNIVTQQSQSPPTGSMITPSFTHVSTESSLLISSTAFADSSITPTASLALDQNAAETTIPATSTEPAPTFTDAASTILSDPRLLTPTLTPAPPIPEARIQILRLGELSKIVSPLPVSTRLTCGEGKVIRFELHGEDGRLLARYMRTYTDIPWNTARIGFNMDFEISAAAELGRLVVSAEDSNGRLIEATSMDIVLMSEGMSEINPPNGLQQRIIIQDPQENSLIQTGKLIVSGRARPASGQPLRAMLVGEDGKILGQRLAGIVIPIPGDYGVFIAEIPYSVSDVTPALLVVYEEGGTISPLTFLTSIKVLLAP